MSRTVPSIIAGLGVILILSGVSMHGVASAAERIGTALAPSSDVPELVDLGQANLLIAGGVGLLVFAAWIYTRR